MHYLAVLLTQRARHYYGAKTARGRRLITFCLLDRLIILDQNHLAYYEQYNL